MSIAKEINRFRSIVVHINEKLYTITQFITLKLGIFIYNTFNSPHRQHIESCVCIQYEGTTHIYSQSCSSAQPAYQNIKFNFTKIQPPLSTVVPKQCSHALLTLCKEESICCGWLHDNREITEFNCDSLDQKLQGQSGS